MTKSHATSHEHSVALSWQRSSESFAYRDYNRAHQWSFDAGIVVAASASPAFRGDDDRVDPEEAFVASLASCHMLSFLALASRAGLIVDLYEDHAVGVLERSASDGGWSMTRVTLRPRVRMTGEGSEDRENFGALHEQAHEQCFLARSVKSSIELEPELF